MKEWFSPTLRKLTETDVNTVSEIAHEAMSYPWSKAVFQDCLKADYAGWVLMPDKEAVYGNIMGFVVALAQADECQILNLCVKPSFQRRGYGTFMLEHVLEYGRKKRMHRVVLEVRSSNQAAVRLYEQAGFVEVGLRKQYYAADWGREDALIFVRGLAAGG